MGWMYIVLYRIVSYIISYHIISYHVSYCAVHAKEHNWFSVIECLIWNISEYTLIDRDPAEVVSNLQFYFKFPTYRQVKKCDERDK